MNVNTTWQLSGMDLRLNDTINYNDCKSFLSVTDFSLPFKFLMV